MIGPFRSQRDAALALLKADVRSTRLSRRAGSFCGQLCVDPTPMTDAQAEWLQTLLDRADLPTMEAAHG